MRFFSSIVMPIDGFILAKNMNGLELQVGIYDPQYVHFNSYFPSHNYIRIVRPGGRQRSNRFQVMIDSCSNKRSQAMIKCCERDGSQGDGSCAKKDDVDDDDGTCPVDCVKEFNTDEEFIRILEKAKKTKSLVVVDFYRTSCGSCKYIEQGFVKLCKGSNDHEGDVIFLKHNVIDEYDEPSEVAERLRIKTVPLFQFYKDGVLLEAFPTRDKERIFGAINKYT